MRRIFQILVVIIVLSVAALFLWPGNSMVHQSIRVEAPMGWKVVPVQDASNPEVWVYPRIGLWGLGLVKVKVDECGNPSSIEDLKRSYEEKHPDGKFQMEVINGRTWFRLVSESESSQEVTMYLARTLYKDGKCIAAIGEPLEKFNKVLNSLQFE